METRLSSFGLTSTISLFGRRRSLRRLLFLFVVILGGYTFGSVIKSIIYAPLYRGYSLRPFSNINQPAAENRVLYETNTAQLDQLPLISNDTVPKPVPLAKHTYRDDGLLQVNSDGPHPIFELMGDAESEWNEKVARQSTTLSQAAKEYRRRYRRNPPKGFDLWWDYVQENNVPLPDEYASIHQDIAPLWGFKPEDLKTILDEWELHEDTWTIGKESENDFIGILRNSINKSYPDAIMQELLLAANKFNALLRPVSKHIPPFRAIFSPHDTPSQLIDWELKQMALDAAKRGEYVDLSNLLSPKHNGWISGCSPLSKVWQNSIHFLAQTPPASLLRHHMPDDVKTFIHNHVKTMDPCIHPDLLLSHGQFLSHLNPGPMPHRKWTPQFNWSPTLLHYDMHVATPLNWVSDVPDQELDWDKKMDERLYWRGATTGILADDDLDLGDGRRLPLRWRWAQRARIVRLGSPVEPLIFEDGEEAFQNTLGLKQPMDLDRYYVLSSPDNETVRVGSAKPVSRSSLVPAITDIHFSGEPITCSEETCEVMKQLFDFSRKAMSKEAGRYKYILDVDGNGWSSRFKRLITGNMVVFKSTIYPEWFADRVQPWLHYVPIQNDFSDLFDALVFFRGDEGKNGHHDHLAKKIAAEGRKWSLTHWRREDITAYMFRLFLEYARATSLDRESMDFILDE